MATRSHVSDSENSEGSPITPETDHAPPNQTLPEQGPVQQSSPPRTPQPSTELIQVDVPMVSADIMRQLSVESGLGQELGSLMRQIMGGQSRLAFYAYLRGLPAKEGAEKVASLFTVIDELSEQAMDTVKALLPELKHEAPRVYESFRTLPFLKEIFKAAQRKAKQPTSARRQIACRKTIRDLWGDQVENAIRIQDNTSRQHCEALRMLARLVQFRQANDIVCVVVFRRVAAGQRKLLATTVDIYEAVHEVQRSMTEEGYFLPLPSRRRLARLGYRQGNFGLIDIASAEQVFTPGWKVGSHITSTPPTRPIRTPGTRNPSKTGQSGERGIRQVTPPTPTRPPVAGPSHGTKRPSEDSHGGRPTKKPDKGKGPVEKPTSSPKYRRLQTTFVEEMSKHGPLATALITGSEASNAEIEQELQRYIAKPAKGRRWKEKLQRTLGEIIDAILESER